MPGQNIFPAPGARPPLRDKYDSVLLTSDRYHGNSSNPAPPPSGAPSPAGSTAAGTTASTPSFTASYSMTKDISLCGPAGECSTGPIPMTVECHADGSCTVTSTHWGLPHQLAFNGTSMSFTGTDPGVVGTFCTGTTVAPAPRVATVTLTLTVGSWSGSGATRKPEELSGPYTVIAPASGQCPEWHQVATLTSQ
jgi:hypothetical protein